MKHFLIDRFLTIFDSPSLKWAEWAKIFKHENI